MTFEMVFRCRKCNAIVVTYEDTMGYYVEGATIQLECKCGHISGVFALQYEFDRSLHDTCLEFSGSGKTHKMGKCNYD